MENREWGFVEGVAIAVGDDGEDGEDDGGRWWPLESKECRGWINATSLWSMRNKQNNARPSFL